MTSLDEMLGTMEFRLRWQHSGIHHTDCRHAQRVNFWRDVLPPGLSEAIARGPATGKIDLELNAGAWSPAFNESDVHRVPLAAVEARRVAGVEIRPRRGRFYPRGILSGVPGVFRENVQPFRCIGLEEGMLTADLNHPLAGKRPVLEVWLHGLRPKFEERGGTTLDWLELTAEGPGMQARAGDTATDFFADDAFARQDEADDGRFYERPRLVQHLDAAARGAIRRLYGKLIRPGADVLDLMGSWVSHLPEELPIGSLTVLGMNREELAANPRATERVVHDLNREPRLPLPPHSCDAVICTASVEYLVHPFAVFAEAARVLKPGGVLAATFSNRWFPPKAIRVWPLLHEFERMGMVLEYFLKTGQYSQLETFSLRGLPRPEDDKYFGQIPYADPVYAVWGHRAR
ncbi:MAG: class I SAM-dependent methyltransferase [Desulfobacterales bacterium]|jgi:SAM-dependent methyltransferase|nr:class I SAM-dependent methyltransferase [Desulfobacterales bacterium]